MRKGRRAHRRERDLNSLVGDSGTARRGTAAPFGRLGEGDSGTHQSDQRRGKKDAPPGGLPRTPSGAKPGPFREGPTLSKRTQPRDPRPHSLAPASIGTRLACVSGRGSEHAKLLWLFIVAHTRWPGRLVVHPWPSNATLADESSLDLRDARRALAALRSSGMVETRRGSRANTDKPRGRILIPKLDAQVKVLVPDRAEMISLWRACRRARQRPAALVTAMVGAYALAAHALDEHPEKWSPVPGPAADLRRFVGASKGSTWGKRVNDLCDLGLLERRSGLWVAPPREWMQGWRALSRPG